MMMEKEKKNETPRQKFVRLAEARTNKIISMIGLLGNLSNRSLYEYADEDINEIFSSIQTELTESRKRFSQSKKGGSHAFKLKNR